MAESFIISFHTRNICNGSYFHMQVNTQLKENWILKWKEETPLLNLWIKQWKRLIYLSIQKCLYIKLNGILCVSFEKSMNRNRNVVYILLYSSCFINQLKIEFHQKRNLLALTHNFHWSACGRYSYAFLILLYFTRENYENQ